jgi:hypothetical protein
MEKKSYVPYFFHPYVPGNIYDVQTIAAFGDPI